MSKELVASYTDELPKDWKLATIGELISPEGIFTDGDWIESKDQDPNGDVRLLQLADIGDGVYKNKSSRYLTKNKAKKLNCTILKKGDLLLARMPDPLGRACIFGDDKKECVTVVDVCIIRTGSSEIEHKWLMYWINSPRFRNTISSLQSGTTRRRISRGNLATITFPNPPLLLKKSIAIKIDELFSHIDAAITALNKSKKLIKQYQQSILKAAVTGELTKEWRKENKDRLEPVAELFELIINTRREKWQAQQMKHFEAKGKVPKKDKWKEKYIKPKAHDGDGYTIPDSWIMARAEQVCEFITKGTTPKSDRLSAGSGQIPFIKVYNLTFDTSLNFDLKPTFTDTETHEQFLARSKVYPGDVLMNIVGPPLGKVSIVSDLYEQWNINQAIAIYRPIAGLNNRLLAYFLLSSPVVGWMLSRTKTTAGQVNLTLEISRNAPIPIMEKKEQEEIVRLVQEKLASANRLLSEVDSQLVRAEKNKQSILATAFSGKLI